MTFSDVGSLVYISEYHSAQKRHVVDLVIELI